MNLAEAQNRVSFLWSRINDLGRDIDTNLVINEGCATFIDVDKTRMEIVELMSERRVLQVAIERSLIFTAINIVVDGEGDEKQQITLKELQFLIEDNYSLLFRYEVARRIATEQQCKPSQISFDVEDTLLKTSQIKERLEYLKNVQQIALVKTSLVD